MIDSVIVTQNPRLVGGVQSMQSAARAAHVRLGLRPWLMYTRSSPTERYDLSRREDREQRTLSTGYVPMIEYLNYVVPALSLRDRVRRFPVVQVVGGCHGASLVPILASSRFVSWIATPFVDEIESRLQRDATLSVRINHSLRRINQSIERWSYAFPRHIFTLSTYTATRLAQVTGLPRATFDVLRFPVDTTFFRPDGPAWSRERPYVLSVGRVDDARKNFGALIRSFSRVVRREPRLDLVIVGPFDPTSRILGLPAELGIGDRVFFPGVVQGDALAMAYRGAAAFAMTSRQEGLGIVVLEAQASGLASVVMRCGGSDELIAHGETGWLVEQEDEEAFAATLGAVLSDPERSRAVGANARAAAVAASSFESFDRRLGRAFEDVRCAPLRPSPPARRPSPSRAPSSPSSAATGPRTRT